MTGKSSYGKRLVVLGLNYMNIITMILQVMYIIYTYICMYIYIYERERESFINIVPKLRSGKFW